MLASGIFEVLRTIQFDNQFVRETNEVDHVTTDGGLPAKFRTELTRSQKVPKTLLGLGRFIPKASGKITLFFIAIHALIQPPPQPSPQGGGSGKRVD